MSTDNPILNPPPRKHSQGDFSLAEVRLANRNSGICLETLAHDVTPLGMHYLLNHFDIPTVSNANDWHLSIDGAVDNVLDLSMQELRSLPYVEHAVTLECAGNGRAMSTSRWPSMPWLHEAVGTSVWGGTPLRGILDRAGASSDAIEWVFHGADKGVDGGCLHSFGRSLTMMQALAPEVMLVWNMNGQPLLPQHGFPLRLIVPGWYGMASVKWLNRIEAVTETYQGYQQVNTYRFRQDDDDPGEPVTHMRVRSLMVPPGVPDWSSRRRLVEQGVNRIMGRAWSGNGVPIQRVEVGINGVWEDATLRSAQGAWSWTAWDYAWQAAPGEYEISCRATDANGAIQPIDVPWDRAGFGNNAVQKVEAWVVDSFDQV